MSPMTPRLECIEGRSVLASVGLGITLYLPQAPTRDEIMRAYAVYRSVCPPDRRSLVTTARTPLFLPMEDDDLRHVYRSLWAQDRRRDDGIVVWDGKESRQWTFWSQGWLPSKPGMRSASFCQILLPEDTDPELLLTLVRGLASELPLLSGHAGHSAQFNAQLKGKAFDQIYAWAKRFLGVEVEDLNLTLPVVCDAIKGASWLTLVGDPLWQKLLVHPARPKELPPGVTHEQLKHARLFRAGAYPTLGDRNRREFPTAYAEVEKLLQPIKLAAHPEFAGRFKQEQQTDAWLHRLLAPEAW